MHGTRVQHNPKSSSCQGASRRSGGYAWKTAGNTPGDLPGAPEGEGKPQGELNNGQKSAEGVVVVETSRGAGTPRLNEETGGLTAAKARTVGGAEWLRKVQGQVNGRAV
jgi:hypothetical protein